MESALVVFRLMAQEFGEISDAEVMQWMSLSQPFLSKKRFGKLYDQALALLTAHRMKLSNVGVPPEEDPLAEIGAIGAGNLMRVGSYSEGSVSVSVGGGAGQFTENFAEFGLTQYGMQYLTLLRMRLIPITSSGEEVYYRGK